MSNLAALGLILALMLASLVFYHLLDRWFHDRTDAIATGIVQGAAISNAHRGLLLSTSWLMNVGMMIGLQSLLIIGWILIGANVNDDKVRLFAYLLAFCTLIMWLGWVALAPFWYLHLKSILHKPKQP